MEIVLAIIGSGVLSVLVTSLFDYLKSRKSGNDGLREGVQTLLCMEIKRAALEHINKEEISSEDLEDILREWHVYHDVLGGNGYLDRLMAMVKELPVK